MDEARRLKTGGSKTDQCQNRWIFEKDKQMDVLEGRLKGWIAKQSESKQINIQNRKVLLKLNKTDGSLLTEKTENRWMKA
jgi:hypothetical protein